MAAACVRAARLCAPQFVAAVRVPVARYVPATAAAAARSRRDAILDAHKEAQEAINEAVNARFSVYFDEAYREAVEAAQAVRRLRESLTAADDSDFLSLMDARLAEQQAALSGLKGLTEKSHGGCESGCCCHRAKAHATQPSSAPG